MPYSIYTDGASRGNPGPASWGFVVYDQNANELGTKSRYEGKATNNAMELMAILEALRHVNKNVPRYEKVAGAIIYSDSQFSISVVTQWVHGWARNGWVKKTGGEIKNLELIKDIYEELMELTVPVEFRKVKGHSGDRGNERADELCNTAIDTYVEEM